MNFYISKLASSCETFLTFPRFIESRIMCKAEILRFRKKSEKERKRKKKQLVSNWEVVCLYLFIGLIVIRKRFVFFLFVLQLTQTVNSLNRLCSKIAFWYKVHRFSIFLILLAIILLQYNSSCFQANFTNDTNKGRPQYCTCFTKSTQECNL